MGASGSVSALSVAHAPACRKETRRRAPQGNAWQHMASHGFAWQPVALAVVVYNDCVRIFMSAQPFLGVPREHTAKDAHEPTTV